MLLANAKASLAGRSLSRKKYVGNVFSPTKVHPSPPDSRGNSRAVTHPREETLVTTPFTHKAAFVRLLISWAVPTLPEFGPSTEDTRAATAELTKLVRQQAGGVGQGPHDPQLAESVCFATCSVTRPPQL